MNFICQVSQRGRNSTTCKATGPIGVYHHNLQLHTIFLASPWFLCPSISNTCNSIPVFISCLKYFFENGSFFFFLKARLSHKSMFYFLFPNYYIYVTWGRPYCFHTSVSSSNRCHPFSCDYKTLTMIVIYSVWGSISSFNVQFRPALNSWLSSFSLLHTDYRYVSSSTVGKGLFLTTESHHVCYGGHREFPALLPKCWGGRFVPPHWAREYTWQKGYTPYSCLHGTTWTHRTWLKTQHIHSSPSPRPPRIWAVLRPLVPAPERQK